MKQRASQVAEELRKIISMILIEDLNDPRMGFVTITRIEVTDDLRFARVFYSVLGDASQKQITVEAMEDHAPFIRRLAIEQINMKYAMDFRFELDSSIEESFRIEEIIKKIHKKDDESKAE